MEAREIRNLTADELEQEIGKAYQELFNLRFQLATRQLQNTNRLRQVRRDIARLKTVRREKALANQ